MSDSVKKLLTLILAVSLALTVSLASAETLQIGIPDDGTNLSRGIELLETAGLITVNPDAGYTPRAGGHHRHDLRCGSGACAGQHAAVHAGGLWRLHHQRHLCDSLRPDSLPRRTDH